MGSGTWGVGIGEWKCSRLRSPEAVAANTDAALVESANADGAGSWAALSAHRRA
jgi:hypothetical protein